MHKFDEPNGPIPPPSALERRWFRNWLACLVVLLALALFSAAALAEPLGDASLCICDESAALCPWMAFGAMAAENRDAHHSTELLNQSRLGISDSKSLPRAKLGRETHMASHCHF